MYARGSLSLSLSLSLLIQVAACSALATLAANAENAISAEHKDFTKVNTARRIASAGGIKVLSLLLSLLALLIQKYKC